ncbi:hypothetical protein HG536_0C01490 [Torulaspora globosa]|uniref:UDENN domain-containing protein n=1 Tax=Torulaspora globosa TaxID=48254 RepID=A0A7G3ZEP5_9SACH|nr:uncharacterized protein HG536_0C01490 [Torulaspora globosa]QLL31981.1 hypothetical protein HG536_0C01490 [Torulaspora globosa]
MDEENPVIVGVCLVDFHHTRGPETEYWCSSPEGADESTLWPNLPFQALPDGSHSFQETFTYFTLLFNEKKRCSPENGACELPEDELEDYTTYFAISCSRQIRSDDLIQKDDDITRSTVQKAIVVISRQPIFGQIKDKLSLVTNAFFLQRDFSDRSIISSLHENLVSMFRNLPNNPQDGQLYVGLSLRKIIFDFGKDVLVLLKAMLLEKQIIFYGNNVEALCNLQFGLISLIPNLLSSLQSSGSPQLLASREALCVADSFKSSDRQSVLKFIGFPLRIFEKGGLFSPYTPLQQMDDIKSKHTQFFVMGSSNSLLVEQKTELCHLFVDVDACTLEIIDKSLHPILHLTSHDKRWIDSIHALVSQSWNQNDLYTPKNSQFEGSEDFIRWQFEEYLTGMLSSAKLSEYLATYSDDSMAVQSIPEELVRSNPMQPFNSAWVSKWTQTKNYGLFRNYTDDRIFDVFSPKHPYSGPDTITILQQKLAATFQNFKKSGLDVNKDSDAQGTKQRSDSLLESVNKETLKGPGAGDKDQNFWSSWKDYFNTKRKVKKKEEDVVKATQHLNNGNSTVEAIGSALVGLGLHYNSAQEEEYDYDTEDSDFEKSRKDSSISINPGGNDHPA